MNTLQKIRELGFLENKLKLDTAQFNESKNELIIVFVYPEKFPIAEEDKKRIIEVIYDDVGELCKLVVKFNKSCFESEVIYNRIEQFIEENYKVLKNEIKRDDIEILQSGDGAIITINCDEMRKQILLNREFDRELIDNLKHKFFIDFEVKFNANKQSLGYQDLLEAMPQVDTGLTDALSKEAEINKMEIELGECFYGKYVAGKPIFIKDTSDKENQEVFLAGIVTDLNFSTYTSKSKNASQPIVEKKKLSFTLTDPSGSIGVVIFPNEKNISSLNLIEEGMAIAVNGFVSVFNENRNIRANSLSRCDILTQRLERVYRKVNEKYIYITPQTVKEVEQMDLFAMANAKEKEFWKTNHEVVVFDLETTGFDPKSCQIIEIGAVKIIDGSIVETFQTLINPNISIPPEIIKLTHIDDEMVADAPSIEQVLPDFYKFVNGAVLSAYNIDFDYSFLSHYGEKYRLKFNNEQIDTLKLARDKVPSLSNYKLGTVVKALDITLNNAHRALADAYATAKVFIKLI